jgi:hypothetical protein
VCASERYSPTKDDAFLNGIHHVKLPNGPMPDKHSLLGHVSATCPIHPRPINNGSNYGCYARALGCPGMYFGTVVAFRGCHVPHTSSTFQCAFPAHSGPLFRHFLALRWLVILGLVISLGHNGRVASLVLCLRKGLWFRVYGFLEV